MPKISRYIKTFKVEDKKNKLIFLRIDDKKLLQKYKTIWIKIEDLKSIKLNVFPVSDDRYYILIASYVAMCLKNKTFLYTPKKQFFSFNYWKKCD